MKGTSQIRSLTCLTPTSCPANTWMGRVHPRFGTPHLSTIATGTVVALAAGLTPIDVLDHMVSIGTLFAFAVVSAAFSSVGAPIPIFSGPSRRPDRQSCRYSRRLYRLRSC